VILLVSQNRYESGGAPGFSGVHLAIQQGAVRRWAQGRLCGLAELRVCEDRAVVGKADQSAVERGVPKSGKPGARYARQGVVLRYRGARLDLDRWHLRAQAVVALARPFLPICITLSPGAKVQPNRSRSPAGDSFTWERAEVKFLRATRH
jgi:hypothetical protein